MLLASALAEEKLSEHSKTALDVLREAYCDDNYSRVLHHSVPELRWNPTRRPKQERCSLLHHNDYCIQLHLEHHPYLPR